MMNGQNTWRLSPLHDAIEPLKPTYCAIDRMLVPLRFHESAQEREQSPRLGLCDASALARTTLKGPAASELLRAQGLTVPEKVFDVLPTSGEGLVARTGTSEFFIEDGPAGHHVSRISDMASTTSSVYEVLRQDASILLCGTDAVDVLRQTCSYEFQLPAAESPLVMTRVAGVSCAILPRQLNGIHLFQFWLDGTYGAYLWETLLEIALESAGYAVGLEVFFLNLGPA
jgi:sarcosine oxidase subunit gamma